MLRVFENRILRRIFESKGDENGEWRWLHNGELHSLYRSQIKSRNLRWADHVVRMEEVRSAFKIVTGKPTGKRPLGRPRRRWEDNIRKGLKENVSIREIGLIRLSIGLLESPCECGIEPPCSISHGVSYDLSFPYVARRRKIT